MPDGRFFVMDDRRSTVACIANEEIVGRIVFRVWLLRQIGKLQ